MAFKKCQLSGENVKGAKADEDGEKKGRVRRVGEVAMGGRVAFVWKVSVVDRHLVWFHYGDDLLRKKIIKS